MKKVLGLDLGITSIGWAFVHEAENQNEESKIIKLGVRVNPLSNDEIKNFNEGKSITINADRTLKRGARRNLDRYQDRREKLIALLIHKKWINHKNDLVWTEQFEIYNLRAKATKERLSLTELASVFLSINKKRGYKSNRKAKSEDETGTLINEIDIALTLKERKITPGIYAYEALIAGRKTLPSFYRSDLLNEFNLIYNLHKKKYEDILTDEFREQLLGKSKKESTKFFLGRYQIETAINKGQDKTLKAYEWRSHAAKTILSIEQLAYVICEINGQISSSSGYLGAIGDRSKILHINNWTVGEYIYNSLKEKPHQTLKNEVFYRQDYEDEFDAIWNKQSQFHPELNKELRKKIRDQIIFYQRPLKSQKGLISICELERKAIEVEVNGKKKTLIKGSRVIPRSSPVFQDFKIWSQLNNIEIKNKVTKEKFKLGLEDKEHAFEYLRTKEVVSGKVFLAHMYGKKESKELILNYKNLEGDKTFFTFLNVFERVLQQQGNDEIDFGKMPPEDIYKSLEILFGDLNVDKSILNFNSELEGEAIVSQPYYKLWHLIYSYEGDNSRSGLESLVKKLQTNFNFDIDTSRLLSNISFLDDYGNLSMKAITKILPNLKENTYDKACLLSGYNHSSSMTREENMKRKLADKLELVKKNSLRNPIVEKILNQLVNVINQILDHDDCGKPDEIRVELARELKNSAKERANITSEINKATNRNDKFRKLLKEAPFNLKNPTRNDIIKYRLYEELKFNGFKDLFTNKPIPKENLFSKDFDIEHIIPKAILFDDSYSNKTLCPRDFNSRVKGSMTAYDCISQKYENELHSYLTRVEDGFRTKSISKAKYDKLKKSQNDIGEGFIERDLRNSQYISKKAGELLLNIVRNVTFTTGKITDRLREDWGLINVMKELNFNKYKSLGLTEVQERKYGQKIEVIKDWTKRNDHRHHAMDALTVAFTKLQYIQYLNNLNAESYKGKSIQGIKDKYTHKDENNKRRFNSPIRNFRTEAKKHLERIFISHKAKNKVVTRNWNKIKGGTVPYLQLTPRGQLHKETIYGKSFYYEVKTQTVNAKIDLDAAQFISKKMERDAVVKRLNQFANDSKKAFTGKNALSKNPIILPDGKELNSKINFTYLTKRYTIRKLIGPDLKVEKVIDKGIAKILKDRLQEYNGDPKKAFSNLDDHPIWIDKQKGIALKRVKISGVAKAQAIHNKRDHFGDPILSDGESVESSFISTGNNHHVAIYKDENGKLHEQVVSFFEAVIRVKEGIPIIDKEFKKELGWEYLFDMKQNEMFIFPSDDFDLNEVDLQDPKNAKEVSKHLFRVQKISTKNYLFTNHLETQATTGDDLKNLKQMIGKKYISVRSSDKLRRIVKVRINHLGEIKKIIYKHEDESRTGLLVSEPQANYRKVSISKSFEEAEKKHIDEMKDYLENTDIATRFIKTMELIRKAYGMFIPELESKNKSLIIIKSSL